MSDYGYNVTMISSATLVARDFDSAADMFGGDSDVAMLGDLDLMDQLGIGSKELLTILCSQSHDSNSNWSSSLHVEINTHYTDRKQQMSDNFRFVIDVYVVAVICFIGFIGKHRG